jgi:hypothetical protein
MRMEAVSCGYRSRLPLVFKASVVVRNLESSAESLDFGEFTLGRVGLRFKELREVFSSMDVNGDDWILEKAYAHLPPSPRGSPDDAIPIDIEDILLLLRLCQDGEIAFTKLAISTPRGHTVIRPYRAMNDLNSYSSPKFKSEPEKSESWKAFADGIRNSQSWKSDWFAAARRFFLSGGAKPFSPARDDVDRMVDYATALESTLVPERDYNTRRIRHRAAALISSDTAPGAKSVAGLIKSFYDIRSRIVHGSGLDDKSRAWLIQNSGQVELRVREILVAAVEKLPPGEKDRCLALAELYDPTDGDRGDSAFDKFKEIKTVEVRKAIAAKIAKLAGSESR